MKRSVVHPDCYKNPQSVFITGASSGIGKALAEAYAGEGVTLFLCGRNRDRLNQTADKCRRKQAEVYTFAFDVTDEEASEKALKQAYEIRPIELVIANAGVSGGVLGTNENDKSTRTILKTNILGVVNTVLPAVSLMKKGGGGQIAIISSMAGYRGMASCPAYSASKACVKAWGEALRGTLKPYHIAVTVVCPGFIETPLTDKNEFYMPFLMKASKAAEIIRQRLIRNPAVLAFPWIMAFGAWLGNILPAAVILPILGKLPKKEK